MSNIIVSWQLKVNPKKKIPDEDVIVDNLLSLNVYYSAGYDENHNYIVYLDDWIRPIDSPKQNIFWEKIGSKEINITPVKPPVTKLTLTGKTEFIKQFLRLTENIPPEEVAVLVWKFANENWTNGYNQGRYNPEFRPEK